MSENPQQATTDPQSPYAVGQRSIKEIIADLSKPLPVRHLRTKTVGGQKITFIPWHIAVKYLDYYAPGWTYDATVVFGPDRVAVVAKVTIYASEGAIHRDATGQDPLAGSDNRYGDPTSNAEAQAIKRAFAKFGLGLYLYQKEDQGHQPSGGGEGQQQASRPASAPTGGGGGGGSSDTRPVSPKQLGMMRAIAAERGIDLEATSKSRYGNRETVDLYMKEGSEFIDFLKTCTVAGQEEGVF